MPAPAAIRYVDRATGEERSERVFGETGLRRLYGNPVGRVLAHHVVSHPIVSALYARKKARDKNVGAFVSAYDVDVDAAEFAVDAYDNVAAFFERRLRAGARPIDTTAHHLVSPVDGRVLAIDCANAHALPVKGHALDKRALVAGAVAADVVDALDAALVFRLAPADYHRVHVPCDGVLSAPVWRGARLHSVHPIALAGGAPSFLNKRSIAVLTSPVFGTVVVVLVGALLVGTITHTHAPGACAKGDELGLFSFGGSTVVLLCDRTKVAVDDDLWATSARGTETFVRLGTRVAAHPTRPD